METEWEAAFWPISKDDVRERLTKAGASRIYPERLMRRVNLYPPDEEFAKHAWVRVRDEGDRITMAIKAVAGATMEGQKEAEVTVNDFETARSILRALGCRDKNYQETKRELWELDGTDITIDEWPFLDPFVEIEGHSEDQVKAVSEKLGFTWSEAYFVSADKLYAKQYGVEPTFVTRGIPSLTFDMPNPFQKE